ncbi:MAG TPA: electron transfer flavoprotein subunit beta/FixA family protein [Candidatus Omnitrophica bacterium]|nr:electron transfer flavoprotein subunit beta/FixA family protein [Candidatus Omnitrophota bacterium]
MKIIVCIKQVPETTNVKIDSEKGTLIREGVDSIINPFDMYAIEEGLRIKERLGEGEVIVISMGPPQADQALREAISMGADSAVLITDKKLAGSDTWATSYTLSKAIQKIGNYSLVLCGKQAIDGDTAQVGPGISSWLDIPQVTYVKKIRQISKDKAVVERMTEEGFDVIETPLPALFTVVKEINEPRLPSLKGKLRARKVEIPVWGVNELGLEEEKIGLDGSPTRVVKIFTPPPREKGMILEGEPQKVVDSLVEKLKDVVIR